MINLTRIRSSLHDVVSLAKKFLYLRPSSLIEGRLLLVRAAALENSRLNPNSVAVAILKVEREVRLASYHGLNNYAREKWGKGRKGDYVVDRRTMATVPFMITSQQKRHLTLTLEYTEKQIRSMTPIDATIIIENSIKSSSCNEWKEEVTRFKSKKEAFAARLTTENIELEIKENSNDSSGSSRDVTLSELTLNNDTKHKYISEPQLAKSVKPIQKEDENWWYEVVEYESDKSLFSPSRSKDNNPVDSVIALYRTEKEANECRDIKQDLAKKRRNDIQTSYSVRRVNRC